VPIRARRKLDQVPRINYFGPDPSPLACAPLAKGNWKFVDDSNDLPPMRGAAKAKESPRQACLMLRCRSYVSVQI